MRGTCLCNQVADNFYVLVTVGNDKSTTPPLRWHLAVAVAQTQFLSIIRLHIICKENPTLAPIYTERKSCARSVASRSVCVCLNLFSLPSTSLNRNGRTSSRRWSFCRGSGTPTASSTKAVTSESTRHGYVTFSHCMQSRVQVLSVTSHHQCWCLGFSWWWSTASAQPQTC